MKSAHANAAEVLQMLAASREPELLSTLTDEAIRFILKLAAEACENLDAAQQERDSAVVYASELRSLLDRLTSSPPWRAGISGGAAHGAPARAVPVSASTARGRPRSYTDSTGGKGQPGPKVFFDALRSRSCATPHPGQVQEQTFRGFGRRGARTPSTPATTDTTGQPDDLAAVQGRLVLQHGRALAIPASWTLWPAWSGHPGAVQVSTHTVWCSRTRRVES